MYLHTLTLDDATKAALQAQLLQVPSPYEDVETFYLEVQQRFRTILPLEMQRTLVRFQLDPTAPGALYIPTGLRDPVLPATPSDGGRAWDKTTFVSEGLGIGFGHFSGQPFGYPDEKQGELFHNIVPVRGKEETASNASSKRDFALHVDNAAVRPCPHGFVLSGVRGDPRGDAVTYIVDARALVAQLDKDTVTTLRAPLFNIPTPESHGPERRRWAGPQPALSGPPSLPEIWMDLNNMQAITAPAAQALDAVRDAVTLPGVAEGVCLTPGDVLLINNRKVLHGRRPFDAQYGGEDRWVQRVYFHPDLWPWRQPGASPWLYSY